MSDKIKLLHLSDSPFFSTGYRNQSFNLMNCLSKKGYEIHYLSNGYAGATIRPGTELEDGTKLDFTIHGQGKDAFCQDVITPTIRKIRPQIFSILLDTFMMHGNDGWFLKTDTSPAVTSFWYPSDGGARLPLRCENILRRIDIPIAMAQYGKDQAKEVHGLDTHHIPHAVNCKQFFPLSKEEKLKLRKKWNLEGKFVVGAVYRNQGRKMPDGMFRAFAIFAKQHPDAVMLCHTDPNDGAAPMNTAVLIQRLGIQNRVRFTGMSVFKSFSDSEMNDIYNLMDVQLSTTSGEGFGVCTVEGMAAEIPIVITDYTTTKQLVLDNGKCGEGIKVIRELTGSWNVDRGIADPVDAADKLEKLYHNSELISTYGKNGRAKALKYFNWDTVSDQFDKLYRKHLGLI